MKIGVIGHNYTHGADFVMDYPDGPGCYLFLLVKTPARLLLNGKKLHLEKNTILFLRPTLPAAMRRRAVSIRTTGFTAI